MFPLDTLISNVTVVTMNNKMEVLFGANIAIDGGKIVSVSRKFPEQYIEMLPTVLDKKREMFELLK